MRSLGAAGAPARERPAGRQGPGLKPRLRWLALLGSLAVFGAVLVYAAGDPSLKAPDGSVTQGPELAREDTFNGGAFTAVREGFPAQWRYRAIYTSSAGTAPAAITLTAFDPDAAPLGPVAMTPVAGMGTLSDGDYANGELYQAVALLTKNGYHTYRVDATDGTNAAVFQGVGPTIRYLDTPTLAPVSGTSRDTYTLSIQYSNHPDPAQFAAPTSISLFLDTNANPTTPRAVTESGSGAVRTYTATIAPPGITGQSLAPGQYQHYWAAAVGGRADRLPASGVLSGPSVPTVAPALSLASPATLRGGVASDMGPQGDWTFRVVYTEANNIAPTVITLTPRDPQGAAIPGASGPMIPTTDVTVPADLRDGAAFNGEVFEATSTLTAVPPLHGTLTYAVSATNGSLPAPAFTGTGPTINALPTFTGLKMTSATDDPATPLIEAVRNEGLSFEVYYRDADRDPPSGGLSLRLYDPNGQPLPPVPMTTTDTNLALLPAPGWRYAATGVNLESMGVRFTGTFSYDAAATDGFPVAAPRTAVSSPNADLRRLAAFKPELSGLAVSPSSGAVGLQPFIFDAVFADGDGTAPVAGYPRLTIQNAGGTDVTFNDQAGPVTSVVMQEADAAPLTTGRRYRYTSVANAFSNLGPGTYSFRVDGSDGTYAVQQSVIGQPVVNTPGTISLNPPTGAVPELARESAFNSNTFAAAAVGFPARWRFGAVYTSPGDQAPAAISLTVTDPDGTVAAPIAMARTASGVGTLSNGSYADGELFEAVALLTLNGDYRYRVDAGDGNSTATLVRNGPTVRYLGNPTLTPSTGTSVDTYTVSVDYSNHPDPALLQAPTSIDLLLDTNDPPTTVRALSAGPGNPVRYTAQFSRPAPSGQSLPPGQYRHFFQVAVGSRSERQPAAGSFAGPSIPVATPALQSPTPALLQGGLPVRLGTEGAWTFRTLYTEANNVAPTRIYLTPRDQSNLAIPGTARDMTVTADPTVPAIFRDGQMDNGEVYEATASIDLTPDFHGTLSYLVEATNGSNSAALTQAGPTFDAPPTFSGLRVICPNDDPNTAGSVEAARNDLATFAVTYRDADQDAPPPGGVRLRIYQPDGIFVSQSPMATTETAKSLLPTTGWEYRATVDLGLVTGAGPGTYSYEVEATDGFPTEPKGPPDPWEWQVSGRNADLKVELGRRPELTVSPVNPTTGVIGTQAFTFQALFRDQDGDPPSVDGTPKLTIIGPTGSVVTFKDGANGYVSSVALPQANPADSTPFTTGRLYRYTTSADAFNRLAAGKHSIRVDAADARYRTAVAVPDAFELTGASIADSPVLTVNPVSPAEGANATVFTWTLNYVDVGNLGPASDYPRIYISDPSGNPVPNPSLDNAPYFLMSLLPGSGSFAEGRQYAFTRSLTTPGLYSYYVEARNTGNGYARLPAPGVIPDKIAAPRLYALPQITASGVTPTSGRLGTQFEWRATYFDADNHPPAAGYPRVTIADPKGNLLQDAANLNVPYFVMSEVDAADTTYNDPGGKVYRALVTPPASGTYTYFVEANCAGGESVRSPAVGTLSSPAVFAPPTIAIVDDAVAQGTTEAKGPIGTSFVWTISYTDADQHLPAATYPRLVITGPDGRVVTNPAANGVPYFTMGPVSPGGYQNGKLYRRTSGAELSMPGFYQYHIEVVDTGGDAARLPASGDTERPLVYRRPTLTRASVNPVAASEGTTFVWSVTYTQQDDLAPDEANDYPRLIITDPNNNVLRDPNNSKNPYAPYFVMPKLSPTATSYKDGVDYVFTRKLVDPGAYRFRIEARDTVGVAVTVPTSGDINGPAVYANPALSLPGLTPSGGPKDTSFTWSVDYTDRDNQAPKFGYPRLVIIGPSGAPLLDPSNNNAAYFPMQPVDPNDTDYVDGSRYTFTRSLSTVGAYRYHIEVVDAGEGQARLPAAGEADGPSVFVGPGFRDVVLTPAKGTPATRFSWTATYMNPDNLAPKINYPRVIITDQAGSVVLDPTNSNQPYHAARKADPSDVIFTDGVVYTVQRSLPAAGTYKYRWEVTDVGENSASVPIGGGDLTGPVVESVVNPRVTPTVGAAGNYTFMVDYFGPAGVQVNNVVATLRISGAATPPPVQMTRTGGTDAATGLTFSAVVNLTVVGDYSFYVDVSDGVATYTSATVAQPRVASPALSSVAVNPAQGIVGRGFAFTARYTHGNRLPPTQIAVKLVKPNATTVTLPMTTTDSDTTLLDGAGWLYQASAPLTDVGDYSFTVEATDGGTAVTSPSTSGPEVIGPQLSQAAVAPNTGGYAGGLFGFSVTYTYGANQAPKFVRLLLTYPDGSKPAPLEMVADPNGAPFNAGRLFTKSVALPRAGTYQYAFESSEDGSIVTAATAPAPGPTVDEPVAPTLNDPSVALTAGQTDLYTYSVLYKQAQGIQPVWVRLLIDVDAAGQARQTVTMLQEDAAATNYATGVRYVYNLSQPPTPGDHNFKILVNTGSKQVETAVLPGPSINRPPTLEPQKVTPANGDENTLFTFAAKYVDPDNDAPAYVRVSVGNKVVTLAKADANQNDYRAGVLYQAQVRLPAGPLVHTFHAADARQAVVRAPVSGTIEGPNVKPATQITVSASPAEATLDGLGSIGISGSLSPAAPKAALKVICALATTQSDGATSEEARKTLDITSDDEGKFSAAFVPDQAGAWKVRVEYAGGTEYGSGSGSANVTIKPATQPLSPGLHMLSLPAAPAGNDLRNALSGGPFDAWVFRAASEGYLAGPILPPGGPDSSPLTAPPGKGLGFWMKSPASLTATVGGRLNDHAQPVAIDVHDGWNLLGSPFLAATSWASAQFETRGRRMSLEEARATGEARAHAWTWDSARNEYRLLDATTPGADRDLAPWQGVWFRSSGAGKLVLAAPSTGSRQPAAARSDRTPRSEREWSIRLVASNGAQRDSFNYAGVTSEGRAAAGSALESPPPARNAVDLYFTGPGADGRYATDFRSPAAGPQTWDMVVETDVLDRLITVSVPDLTRLPNNLVAYLEDPDAGGKRVYLRTAGGYTFSPGETGRRHLRLVVQPRDAGSLLVSDITLQPARGGRAIGYALSRAAAVTVEILSPSWKRVAVVADRQPAAAGRASVVWDGRRVDGVSVPAGLYIVQVTASAEDQQTARAIKLITITR